VIKFVYKPRDAHLDPGAQILWRSMVVRRALPVSSLAAGGRSVAARLDNFFRQGDHIGSGEVELHPQSAGAIIGRIKHDLNLYDGKPVHDFVATRMLETYRFLPMADSCDVFEEQNYVEPGARPAGNKSYNTKGGVWARWQALLYCRTL
jgi:hypothetical protein